MDTVKQEVPDQESVLKRQINSDELKELFLQLNESVVMAQSQMAELNGKVAELQEQLAYKDMLLQRKSRLEGLGKMAAGVAHEIRNPLGGICLYTDLLIRRLSQHGDMDWECSKAQKIRENILALEQIVSDMLNFTNEVKVRPQAEEISAVIEESVSLAKGHNCYRSHHVDLSLASATLCVDKGQLQRVFLNIILNAFQAMEERGQLTIRGRHFIERRTYEIAFCDTGTGIPEDKLDDIFNPFMTLKDEGTGLGLAIGHRVIEHHGGRVEVKNNANQGCTFTVTLPVNVPEEEEKIKSS